MSKQAFYNGILYQIEYQPELSNNDYTQHKVYHIKTEEENYGKARKAIVSVMEEELGHKQGYLWLMLFIHTINSPMMRTWMYLYLLLSYLMMTEYDYR